VTTPFTRPLSHSATVAYLTRYAPPSGAARKNWLALFYRDQDLGHIINRRLALHWFLTGVLVGVSFYAREAFPAWAIALGLVVALGLFLVSARGIYRAELDRIELRERNAS
jgi:hypothetical protein